MRQVAPVVLVLLLASCGRVAFDANDADASTLDSAASDALVRSDSPRMTGMDAGDPDVSAPDSGDLDAGALDAGAIDASDPDGAAPTDGGGEGDAEPDASTCSEIPCRLLAPQCGCGPAEMCQRRLREEAVRTCMAAGAAGDGETCTENAECAAGTTCVVDALSTGHCEPYCTAMCGTHECISLPVTTEPIGACAPDCSPSAGTGCGTGLTCVHILTQSVPSLRRVWSRGCVAGKLPGATSPCLDGVCAPGNACIDGTCERLCNVPGGICLVGMTCQALTPRLLVPGTGREFGVCR